MRYISAKEMAERWGISLRLVQKYCAQGRIVGARKFSGVWEVPWNSSKPTDPRKKQGDMEEIEYFRCFFPLIQAELEPGTYLKYVAAMEEGEQRDIAQAEYYYFTGKAEQAIEWARPYLNSSKLPIKLCASLISLFAHISVGQVLETPRITRHISTMVTERKKQPVQVQAMIDLVVVASHVLLHLPLPQAITEKELQGYTQHVPRGLREFAFYVHAHYFYSQKRYDLCTGIAETALALDDEGHLISDLYLHLVLVMAYMGLKKTDKAKEHLRNAWECARPDHLIQGIGEHMGLLYGIPEGVIRPQWPEEYREILDIYQMFFAGWRNIHNRKTGENITGVLTATEFSVAMLMAKGWKNQEIANHLNLSPHTIKDHVSVILQKLGVDRRSQVKPYVLS